MKSKIRPLLLSVLVAFGLWLYVITVEQPESEKSYYDIPVVMQNESILSERGLMIVSERPTVTLHLAGTRTNLNQLNESNINVIANVASIVTAGTHELSYTVAYPGNVPSGAITRRGSDPNMVTVKVENRITKQIEVVPDYMDTAVPEGMIAKKEELVLDYPTVEVSGPESVMDNITQAVIRVDLAGQTQTIVGDYAYTLCNDAGEPVDSQWVATNVETVNLTLEIHRIKEIELKLNVVEGGGATVQTSDINIQPQSILISGSDARLAKLDALEIGTLDLGTLEKDSTLHFDIVLPEGLTNETGISTATVEVKFRDLRTVNFDITNIQLINKPEGKEAQLETKILEMKLRGPANLIEKLTIEDIQVIVDLAGAKVGTEKYDVQVKLPEGFSGVEAMGSYSAMITLSDLPEDEA